MGRRLIVDYHMHLRDDHERLSFTVEAVERFVETAAARGVDEIGFTEHVYYFRQTERVWTLPYQTERCRYDLDQYVGAVVEAKGQGLPVKLGLEVDWWPQNDEALAAALEPYPWDFLLGSVHWLGDVPVDSEEGLAEAAPYFAAVADAARSGRFDVLSHLDLVKIFGLRPRPEDYDGIADTIAEAGVAVEVSTAGWRKPVGELYPCRMRRPHHAGVRRPRGGARGRGLPARAGGRPRGRLRDRNGVRVPLRPPGAARMAVMALVFDVGEMLADESRTGSGSPTPAASRASR
jgi:histidinol-phosphatase (PHP family)